MEERLSKAKSALLFREPFFANLLMRMEMTEVPDEAFFAMGVPPTMCTDGKNIWYSKSFVGSLNDKQLLGVLKHEVYHMVFVHPARRGSRDPRRWNMAADYSINLLLEEDELPTIVKDGKQVVVAGNLLGIAGTTFQDLLG